jgi:hypothetical protein
LFSLRGMLSLLITILVTFVVGTLIGHVVHWFLHQRWSGPFYKSHMSHHVTMYPKTDLLSETYRGAGAESGWVWFTIPIAGIVLPVLFGLWCLGVPIHCIGVAILESILIGYLHGYIHDSFHLIGHWMERLPGYSRLRVLHFVHHFHMQRNFGIFTFHWDRVFGTLKEK